MRKFIRLQEPDILRDNWVFWGKEYEKEKKENSKHRFSWKQSTYQQIISLLLLQTQEHCSYCDNYHLKKGDFSVDHFKPKSKFFAIAYKWDNLFFCCWHCQQAKGQQYSDNLLRPDVEDFSFSRYFTYNYSDHEIRFNDSASEEDQLKAIETIRIFDLNHTGLKRARRLSFTAFNKDPNPIVQDYSYRFILD